MSHNYKYILLLIVLSPVFTLGQQSLDSLKSLELSGINRSDHLKVLYQIVRLSVANEDSTIKYANQLLSISEPGVGEYAFQANLHLGQAYKNKGDYETSINYLFNALELSEELDDSFKSYIPSLIGSVYGRIGDVEKLRLYFNSALLEIKASQPIDSFFLMVALNNYAEAYYNNQYYDSALRYYHQAFHWAQMVNHEFSSFFILGNLGMVNTKLNRLDTAEAQLNAAISYIERNNDIASLLTFKIHLADVYIEKGEYSVARRVLSESLNIAISQDLKEQIRDVYERLSHLYDKQGDFKKSLRFYKKYIAHRDSIKDVETVRKIGDMRTEFEVGQKQTEVDLLTAEKKNQRLILIGVTLFALVLVILAFVIYRFYQSKAKINKELERLNQTKDKFFSIISHDLRGPVSSFMGISRMIKYMVKAKETDQLLAVADDIDDSVARLSDLLDNLLNWAMQQQGHFPNVPEKIHLHEAAQDLVKTMDTMARGKQIDLKADIDTPIELWVDRNTTMTILRNLVNNALKFTPEGGQVTISAEENGAFAEIKVSDTGVGIPKDKLKSLFKLQDKKSTYGTSGEKGLGLGLQLVYEFVEMNNGKIEVNSEEGVGITFIISLPLFAAEGSHELVN